jgi:PAS domain S-box-containing protein
VSPFVFEQYIEKDLGFILAKAQGMLKLDSLAPRIPPVIWQYALAIVSVGVALVMTNSLERYTTLRTPFFFLAIILSAWFGRMGPGLLAVGLSTLAVDYYFAPTASGPGLGVDGRPFILLFSLSGLIACWISVQRRRAEEALKGARDELELKVEDRTAELQRINEELRAEIAERKNAEAALLSSEAQLKQAQAVAHLGSYEVDVLTGHTRWSDEVFRILGLDPARGSLSRQDFIERIVHPEDREYAIQRYDQAVQEGKVYDLECRVIRPDRSVRFVQSMGEPIRNTDGAVVRLVGALLDITERKQAEENLREAQAELAHVTRVATLGEMTASIAHEINQPLAAVVNNASACMRWLAGPTPNLEEARHSAALITADGHRAGEIISRIRALALKAPPRKDWVNINETILEVIALARSEVHRNRASLQTQLSSDVPLILGDRIQLQQVILNLIINAIEAMKGISEGPRELQVGTGKDELQGVLVTVRDSGPGLDPDSLDHLFTAFYTTKPQGMGMGLAISRSIIEAHGGRLWATANKHRGATFQFTLPADAERVS